MYILCKIWVAQSGWNSNQDWKKKIQKNFSYQLYLFQKGSYGKLLTDKDVAFTKSYSAESR